MKGAPDVPASERILLRVDVAFGPLSLEGGHNVCLPVRRGP
jgi:hypothetical protein